MKKIAILGCGQLGSIVADAIASGLLPDYTLCAAMSRKLPDAGPCAPKRAARPASPWTRCWPRDSDYVVETAAVQVAKESCLPGGAGKPGWALSPSASALLRMPIFYAKACAAAKAHGGRIYLPHGAVGGFDVLHTVALMAKAKNQPITAEIHTHKGPASLKTRRCSPKRLMTTPESDGAGRHRCRGHPGMPTKVNVAVAAAPGQHRPRRHGCKNYQRGRLCR